MGIAGHPVILQPKQAEIGLVTLSYLAEPLAAADADPLAGHSNRWECREIARLFLELNYAVEGIDWSDDIYRPAASVAAVMDIYLNLQRLAPFLSDKTVKLLHLTGSYGPFQNQAELSRVADFEARTRKLYTPKRLTAHTDLMERSLRLADRCSLIGNEATLATYPKFYRDKITLVPVSGSLLSLPAPVVASAPARREFLWFFGGGAVHKGLDLVIEVFSRRTDLTLHVVGPAAAEPDFIAACQPQMASPNIHCHGSLDPDSEEFSQKLANVFCFIAPSCSEGMSPAVVTCMQKGFLPIISYQTGVDLPQGCGYILENLDETSIEAAIDKSLALTSEDLRTQREMAQNFARQRYSRQSFRSAMYEYLVESMKGRRAWV